MCVYIYIYIYVRYRNSSCLKFKGSCSARRCSRTQKGVMIRLSVDMSFYSVCW